MPVPYHTHSGAESGPVLDAREAIEDATIITAKVADANITTAKLADAGVTTAKLADANVTTAKIADDAVTTGKIADGTIANADINASAAIDASKIDVKCGVTSVTGSASFSSGLASVNHVSASLEATPDDNASFAVGLTGASGAITLNVYKTSAAGGFTASSAAKTVTWVAWRTKA